MNKYDINIELLNDSKNFVKQLYKECDGMQCLSVADPFHDMGEIILDVLYLWLRENNKVYRNTPFAEVCEKMHMLANDFFDLDMSNCSEITRMRWMKAKDDEWGMLTKKQFRFCALSDFRIVFDLTQAGSQMKDVIIEERDCIETDNDREDGL